MKQESHPVSRNIIVLSLTLSFCLFLFIEASRRVRLEPLSLGGTYNSEDPEKAGTEGGRVVRGRRPAAQGWLAGWRI